MNDLWGQIHHRNGNESLILNDPKQVWIVQLGLVAIFVVTVNNDQVIIDRQYLCTLNPHDAFFGAIENSQHLLAIPLGSVDLLELNCDCWQKLCTQNDIRIQTWLKDWLGKISHVLDAQLSPTNILQSEAAAHHFLVNRQVLQITEFCWVEIKVGCVYLQGINELFLTAEALPLLPPLRLFAAGDVQIVTSSLEHLSPTVLLSGLARFHTFLLYKIRLSQEERRQIDLSRLDERIQLRQQVVHDTLENLAGLSPYSHQHLGASTDPLLQAVEAVGRVLGIKICPPGLSDKALTMDPLAAIARASRLRMRRVLLRDNWWKQDNGALVAYTKSDQQPIALLPFHGNSYEVFNPTQPGLKLVKEPLATMISPVAYMFYRSLPEQVMRGVDIIKFSLHGRQVDILIIALTSIMVTMLGLITPHATLIIMDSAIPDSDRILLLQICLGLLIAALSTTLFQITQRFSLLRLETAIDHDTQVAVWDRLLKLPVSFFRQYTAGDLQSRVSSVSAIRRLISGRNLINLVSSFFTLFYIVQLFYYSYELALVAVGLATTTLIVTIVSGILMLSKVRALLDIRGKIFGRTVQIINGISKLHIAGAEEQAFAFWSKDFAQQVKLELSIQAIKDFVFSFNTVTPITTTGLLFLFSIRLLDRPQVPGAGLVTLSLGTFLAFNIAFVNFTQGTTLLSNTLIEIFQMIPQWQRTQPILQAVPEIDLNKADPGRLTGRILIDRVTFRYQLDAPLVLDNISIQVEPGEFIALVGSSGSGKSTILRLLLGFETSQTGTIYYDGQDLVGLDVNALRRQLGVVLQNGQLTAASIFENIAGSSQVTLDEAWEAAKMAGLSEDIQNMPMQMHTIISEGSSNISGGQRQRLLIARALVHKPRILLFDEATSALDNITQSIVSKSLDQLQVTRLVIAHGSMSPFSREN